MQKSAGQHHALGNQARWAREQCRCLSAQTPGMQVAAALERPCADGAAGDACPPIKLVYFHFHNAIRAELDDLARDVLALEPLAGLALLSRLAAVKERYQFLEQVYSIHSSVEDEVRRPCAGPARQSQLAAVEERYCIIMHCVQYLRQRP